MKKQIARWVLCGVLLSGFPTFSACKEIEKSQAKYEITAEYVPENKTLAGAVKVSFQNGGENAVSLLKFQLYPNAYRKDATYKVFLFS